MSAQYPIGAVSKATGLPVDTLRAWERRYQAVVPSRTERGRMYGDADIRRLMLLRKAVERGQAIGQVARLTDAELEELNAQARCYTEELGTPASEPPQPLLDHLLKLIHAYDATAANAELGRLALLMRPRELVHRVVAPLMSQAGELWAEGAFDVAHEHLLSACVRNLLGGLVRLQQQSYRSGKLLLAAPAGELHEFGILAAAMLGVAHDFDVVYLGPNLPAHDILLAAGQSAPRAVVLGVLAYNATDAVRTDMREVAGKLAPPVELWVGGSGARAVAGDIAREGTHVLDTLVEYERHLERLESTPIPRG
jgi:MerR family transcriptional regulator, light-induced transcriptional regulator